MDYVLLTPDEAGALLSLDRDEIIGLIQTGELGGLRVAGHWRIPLKSITALLAAGVKSQSAQALERVFNDHGTWHRVFGAHPEVTQEIAAGDFPTGSVGAYLKVAIAMASGTIAQAGAAAAQDPEYGADEAGDAESATG
jgi:excisionase family DNA binding protein